MHADNLLARVVDAGRRDDRIESARDWILREFDRFYAEFLDVPWQAKSAFESMNHPTSIWLSRHRISLYSSYVHRMAEALETALPDIAEDADFFDRLEAIAWRAVEDRYESDVAFSFVHSLRRMVFRDQWQPVEYGFWGALENTDRYPPELLRRFAVDGAADAALIERVLALPNFAVSWRDVAGDGAQIAARINRLAARRGQRIDWLEMVDAGFYRNRGAYLVGRLGFEDGSTSPCILALLNSGSGIYCDAVILNEHLAHNLFSSTLANFHVTTTYYHELCAYLHEIMPHRPLGLHYSTIGYNHLGKVAVINELKQELAHSSGVFDTAIGEPGTVAIGFAGPGSAYNLKVIRNHPTAGYKWGTFEGIESVKQKYGRVHEINRTGSMLDNIIYFNIALEQSLFSPDLLDELLREASETVSLQGDDDVVFKYLIVQPRMTPLPVFLERASEREARVVMESLGDCIKNNAAANIFNKDLDARNYGVSHFLKVYLFDYDALEDFVDVKIRSNLDRIEGEEDIPDWYFEDGVVFLPEEIEAGLCINNREHRQLFRGMHGDLLTTGYWENLQRQLQAEQVPLIKVYPDTCKLPQREPGADDVG